MELTFYNRVKHCMNVVLFLFNNGSEKTRLSEKSKEFSI